ncbi:MAG: glycosyltransferase family 4 protein [Pyrinomonadaceae bacterium]
MKKSQMQWVVAFKGSRDAYQVPRALAEAGLLEALVTDWYPPFDAKWFHQSMKALPTRIKDSLGRRYSSGVPSSKVHMRPLEMVRTKLHSRSASDRGDNRIGAVAGRLAVSKGAGVLSYSYYAHAAFSAKATANVPKIIFQVHPHPRSVRELLTEEIQLMPEAQASLRGEIELNMPPSRYTQLCEEPLLADMCLVASNYTKKTLVENGVKESSVRVIPYGVDLEKYRPADDGNRRSTTSRFRVLFAGQMIQRKGLSYLLEAWKRLSLLGAELILVGRGGIDKQLLAKYEGLFTLKHAATAAELRELYQISDLCCMPSLVEGFGLVYLESLACGTPVIGTPHTGAADLVCDGEEGFIVPIRSVEALMERLEWCYRNRRALADMRVKARRTAELYTWDRFRACLVKAVREAA